MDDVLDRANIPEAWHNKCLIHDSIIFTPRVNQDGTILATSEQVRDEWAARVTSPQKTAAEKLRDDIDYLLMRRLEDDGLL